MRRAKLSQTWKPLATVLALSAVAVLPARAMPTTWYVANDGSDVFVPPCGSKPLPCRSVSKAISLAATGDTIIVGPGVYGDINNSGTFGDFSGEEAAEIGSGCECMIKINKQLTIVSRDGAEVTILDAAGLTQNVVAYQTAGAVFGKPNKGFTMRGGTVTGLLANPASTGGSVAGNIASSNLTGFDVTAIGAIGKQLLTNNIAAENSGHGFVLHGDFNSLQHNRAVNNGGAGFQIAATGDSLKQNVAVANNYGFQVQLDTVPGHPFCNNPLCFGFTTNSAVGNTTAGVLVQATVGVGGLAFMEKSNVYGNGDSANNCGGLIDNQVPANNMSASLDLFYWGAATGIGPNPADTGGGPCVIGAGAGDIGAAFFGDPHPTEYPNSQVGIK